MEGDFRNFLPWVLWNIFRLKVINLPGRRNAETNYNNNLAAEYHIIVYFQGPEKTHISHADGVRCDEAFNKLEQPVKEHLTKIYAGRSHKKF